MNKEAETFNAAKKLNRRKTPDLCSLDYTNDNLGILRGNANQLKS